MVVINIKKSKQFLIFLLSIIIACSVFPSTILADTLKINKVDVRIGYYESFLSDGRPTGSFLYYEKNNCVLSSSNWVSISGVKQKQFSNIKITTVNKFSISDNDDITINIGINNGVSSRYKSFNKFMKMYIYSEHYTDGEYLDVVEETYCTYNSETSTFEGNIISRHNLEDCYIVLSASVVEQDYLDSNFVIGVTSFDVDIKSEQQGFFDNIKEWFENLFELLTSKFTQLVQNISDLGSKIGNFFSSLTESIKGFFSDLGQNIKEQFNSIISNLRTWFSNVGDWFSNLGNSISGFFEKLWNRIYWGNEKGESEYQKPVINNKLNDILDTLDGYQLQLKGAIDTIGTAAEDVSTYISTGSSVITGIMNVGGIGFTALIVFGIVFVLVRKVVGR